MNTRETNLEQDNSAAVAASQGKEKEATDDSIHQQIILPFSTTKDESCVPHIENVSEADLNDTSGGVLENSSISDETGNVVTQVIVKGDAHVMSPVSAHQLNCNGDEFGKQKLASPSDKKLSSNKHHHESDVCFNVTVIKSDSTQQKIDESCTSSGISDGGNITGNAPHIEKVSTQCSGSNQYTGNGCQEEMVKSPLNKETFLDERHHASDVGPGLCSVQSDEDRTNTHDVPPYEPSEECIELGDIYLSQLSVTQKTELQEVSREETAEITIHSTVYPKVDTSSQSKEHYPEMPILEKDMLDKRKLTSTEKGDLQPSINEQTKQKDLVMEKATCVGRSAYPEVTVLQAAMSSQNRNFTDSPVFCSADVIENANATGSVESEYNVIEVSLPSHNVGETSESFDKNLLEKVHDAASEFSKDLELRDYEGSANKDSFDSEEDKSSNLKMLNSHDAINALEVGDLVWAKVRSHPWWPAQILDPEEASKSVIKLQKAGRYLVAFFGDYKFAWLQQSQLQEFKPNFKEKVKQSTMKTFCKAVNEALEELCLRSELGLACKHFKGTLCSRSVFKDTALGTQTIVKLQTHEDVVSSINMFDARKTLDYLKGAACSPVGRWDATLEMSELRGYAYGLRNCLIFSEWKIDCNQVQELSFGKVTEDLAKRSKRKRTFASLESFANEHEESEEFEDKVSGPQSKAFMQDNHIAEGVIDFDKEHCIDDAKITYKEKQDSDSKTFRKQKKVRQIYLQNVENKAQDDRSEALFTSTGYQNDPSKKRRRIKNSHTACDSLFSVPAVKLGSEDRSCETVAASDLEVFQLDMREEYDSTKIKSPKKEKRNHAKKGNKFNKILKFGDSMRKVASELTGATSKKLLDSELVSEVSLIQIYEGLNNSARDPLNYSDINPHQDRTIKAILNFRNEVYSKSAGISEDLIVVSGEKKRKRGKHQMHNFDDNVKPVSKATYHYIRKRKSDIQEKVGKKTKRSLNSDSREEENVFGSFTNMENFTEPRRFDKNIIRYSRRSAIPTNDSEEFDGEKPLSQMPLELFMKFPQDTDLPSESELNDKFMSFGPLQSSETRVDKFLAAALVVFKDGQDAESAWKYSKKNPLFGNIDVTYRLQYSSQSSKAEVNFSDVEEPMLLQGESSSQHGLSRTDIDQIKVGSTEGSISNSNVLNATGNIQDQMMTLLQQVSVIVGTSPVTSDTT